MASKKTREAGYGSLGASSDELLDELASFLYDAYQRLKDNNGGKIELEEGQIAENEEKL